MEIAGLITSIVAALAAGVSSYVTFTARGRAASVRTFHEIREFLKQNRGQLVERALAYHAAMRHEQDIPLLSRTGWIQSVPAPLHEIELTLAKKSQSEDVLLEAMRHTEKYWPRSEAGVKLKKYSDAINAFDRPSLWQNRRSYRLLEVDTSTGPIAQPPSLKFSMGYYFDMIDTSEILGYEGAARIVRNRPISGARAYRSWLGDPFALDKRCVVPGINVLTVRQSSGGAHFFLHDRRGENVALSMNTIHVMPAIEFQPGSHLAYSHKVGLDIWHAISVGYLREFLGITESEDSHSVTVDPTYTALEEARRNGSVVPWFLGIGLDPLTWKPEILMACVFSEELFDAIFTSMVHSNPQGPLLHSRIGAPGVSGLPFSRETVSTYANDPGTLPAGRACLTLAWRSRKSLSITES